MTPTFTAGNAGDDGAPFRGWFVGDLTEWAAARGAPLGPDAATFRDTRALEVRWGQHAAGEPRPGGWAPRTPAIALSILVSGDFRLIFRANAGDAETEVPLGMPGDYVMWGAETEHRWYAVSDSVVLTVRWPHPGTSRAG